MGSRSKGRWTISAFELPATNARAESQRNASQRDSTNRLKRAKALTFSVLSSTDASLLHDSRSARPSSSSRGACCGKDATSELSRYIQDREIPVGSMPRDLVLFRATFVVGAPPKPVEEGAQGSATAFASLVERLGVPECYW